MKNSVKIFTLIFGLLISFTSTEIQVFANQNEERSYVTTVKASHILVDTKEEADLIETKLENGENFEMLAKRYSKCPSGADGGDLGYFRRGQMVKSFETAAFELPIGKVSAPVKTQFGWHIIKVYDKR